jgi:hypothetical protein
MAIKKKGRVSLSDIDRQYVSESLKNARGRIAAAADQSEAALLDTLERFGLTSDRVKRLRKTIDDMDVRESVEKAQDYLAEQIENARDYARENPGKVIGGAAGVLVGASLLAYALTRGEKKRPSRKAARKKRSAKKASSKRSR